MPAKKKIKMKNVILICFKGIVKEPCSKKRYESMCEFNF